MGIAAHRAHNGQFGFTNGDYVCFSIETRKEKGEDYSAIEGLFRQYELTYIIADERDLVRLRTNYRQGEEVCLYRLQVDAGTGPEIFPRLSAPRQRTARACGMV